MKCSTISYIKEKYQNKRISQNRRRVIERHLKECSDCRLNYGKVMLVGMIVDNSPGNRKLQKLESVIFSIIFKFLLAVIMIAAMAAGYVYFESLSLISADTFQTTISEKNDTENKMRMYIDK